MLLKGKVIYIVKASSVLACGICGGVSKNLCSSMLGYHSQNSISTGKEVSAKFWSQRRLQAWHSGSGLTCRSKGRAIVSKLRAWFCFFLQNSSHLFRLSPACYHPELQNCGLKHHSFLHLIAWEAIEDMHQGPLCAKICHFHFSHLHKWDHALACEQARCLSFSCWGRLGQGWLGP